MIRKLQRSDTERVMEIWLNGNTDAHPFIPREYWESNYDMVREQISQAEVFVCDQDGEIQGFIGMADSYIAGIFVDKRYRSRGIGRQLLDYAKQTFPSLTLGVYEKNGRATSFYLREGFSILSKQSDEATGELAYTMGWNAANIDGRKT